MSNCGITRVALHDGAALPSVVLYLITKSGQALNMSQASWLIASGRVKLNGSVERRLHLEIPSGLHCVEIHERIYPFEVMPVLLE
jgi:ribosome-associated protein YbcJ (S4-like RNA binding protein)